LVVPTLPVSASTRFHVEAVPRVDSDSSSVPPPPFTVALPVHPLRSNDVSAPPPTTFNSSPATP